MMEKKQSDWGPDRKTLLPEAIETWSRRRKEKSGAIFRRNAEEMRSRENYQDEMQLRVTENPLNSIQQFQLFSNSSAGIKRFFSHQELNKFNLSRHLNVRCPMLFTRDEKIPTSSASAKNSNTILYRLFIILMLISRSHAKPVVKGDRIEPNRIETEIQRRAVRHVPSPSLYSPDKLSTAKRDVTSLFSNVHKNPQRLVTKMGFYVEIKKNGKVKGSRRATPYSLIELVSIHTGVVAIRGRKSGRYLAMDKKGRLVGRKTYTSASNFYESMVENNNFVFYQYAFDKMGRKRGYKREVYMGFDKRGRPRRGKKVQRNDSSAHFQKMIAVSSSRNRRQHYKKASKRRRSRKNRHRKVKSA